MTGHGAHDQLPGIWSDDASMALCAAESLLKGFDPELSRHPPGTDQPSAEQELRHFGRFLSGGLASAAEDSVDSGGYVVHTLEASVWCPVVAG